MNFSKPITSELQAKIDALPDENLKSNILRVLCSPGKKTATNEKIFENMINTYHEVMKERALREARLYKWSDDEVINFIDFFQKQKPEWYAEYLQQERNGRQIDADLAWNMRKLEEQWLPGLNWEDYGELFGKVRDYADAQLI